MIGPTTRLAALLLLVVLALVAPAGPAGAQESDEELVVVTTELAPFVIDDDGDADGFYMEIWQEVADELGVRYRVVWAESFTAMLETLERGEADVAVAPLAPTAEREARFDFTSAVVSSGPQLGFHDRGTGQRRGLIQAVLSWSVLRIVLFAVLGLVVLAHIIWFVERHEDDEGMRDISSDYIRGVWDSFWWAAVTVTTVGYGDTVPRSTKGRAIALVAMLVSLFLVGAIVSQTTALLAENVEQAPSSTLSDIGGRRVAALEGSSFADYLEGKGVNVVGFPTQEAAFAAVRDGELDLLVTNPYALSVLGPDYDVQAADGLFFAEFETFGLAQDSPWREPINAALADLQQSGEVTAILERWTG